MAASLTIRRVEPWAEPGWDEYVASHPRAAVYHSSTWCRVVAETGGYRSACLVLEENGRVEGILPLMAVKSRLTGNRLVSLPFSDVCYPLASCTEAARALIREAGRIKEEEGCSLIELRGASALPQNTTISKEADAEGNPPSGPEVEMGFSPVCHYTNYITPLTPDTEAVKKTFHKTSVRQTINKSFRLGVQVRRGEGEADMAEFYRLYLLNRRRHGIPPQPERLFDTIFATMRSEPQAILYLAEHGGRAIASLVVLRYRSVAYAKYEGVDEAFRHLVPVYGLLWKSMEEAALDGFELYDWGRTAKDNPGLNAFKSRWGTEAQELSYYFHPPSRSPSVVDSSSLKYRLFTAMVRRMPLSICKAVGGRIFRHFG